MFDEEEQDEEESKERYLKFNSRAILSMIVLIVLSILTFSAIGDEISYTKTILIAFLETITYLFIFILGYFSKIKIGE